MLMTINAALVSVIIPAYNAARYVKQTIESVLSQTYSNIEILVVDDGSIDSTPEIVKQLASQDSRVVLLQQSNAGVAAARNLAIQKSRGEFIAPLDADDIWYPEKLEKQVNCFVQSDETVGLVYTWSVFLDENGQQMSYCQCTQVEGKVLVHLIFENSPGNSSSPLIRRSCLEEVGVYNHQYKEQGAQGCEDWDLYLRIAEKYEFRVVPECLVGYRQIVGSMSFNHASMVKGYEMIIKGLKQRHPSIPEHLYRWSLAHFYWYIALKCRGNRDYANTLQYLFHAIRLDYFYLLNASLYLIALFSFLKILLQPTSSFMYLQTHEYGSSIEKQISQITPEIELKLESLPKYEFKAKRRLLRNYFDWLLRQRIVCLERSMKAI